METTLYLIRHGKTAANIDNRFAGRTDEQLHGEGRAQIGELARGLAGQGLSRIVVGPLKRTRETAAIIAAQLALPVDIDDRLTEILIPHWDGLTKDAIRARFGPEYPTWLVEPHEFCVAGCETIADVQERAVKAAEGLFSRFQGEAVLVVSHLIVVRALLLYYLGRPIREFRSIKVDNGAVTTLTRDGDDTTRVDL